MAIWALLSAAGGLLGSVLIFIWADQRSHLIKHRLSLRSALLMTHLLETHLFYWHNTSANDLNLGVLIPHVDEMLRSERSIKILETILRLRKEILDSPSERKRTNVAIVKEIRDVRHECSVLLAARKSLLRRIVLFVFD